MSVGCCDIAFSITWQTQPNETSKTSAILPVTHIFSQPWILQHTFYTQGFEPVTSRYRCDALTNWAMTPPTLGAGHLWVPMFPWGMNHVSFHHSFIPHGNIGTHKWPAPNVSGFIAQLVRVSHRYPKVTGSNPIEVLNFSSFFTQLQKLRS